MRFQVLTHTQVEGLFQGRLGRTAIYTCLRALTDARLITPIRMPPFTERVYFANTGIYAGVIADQQIPRIVYRSDQLTHRVGCNDAWIGLAKHAFVSGIIPEHEFGIFEDSHELQERKPDGFFVLSNPERQGPMLCALEVETTLRSQCRIEAVVEAYVRLHVRNPSFLSGTIIVAHSPLIARYYREAVAGIAKDYPGRFRICEKPDLSDVQESTLGKALSHPVENPFQVLQKLCTRFTPEPSYFVLRNSTRIQPPDVDIGTGSSESGARA